MALVEDYETNTLDDVCITIDRDRQKAQGIGSQFRRYSMYSVPMYQLDFQHAYYANAIYMIVWNDNIWFTTMQSFWPDDRRHDQRV